MGFVDLHVHSNASDGTFSPSQVVELAKNAGLDAFALTDHDTTAGVPEALEKGRDLNIEVIPGIEVSSSFDGTEIHILGLFVNSDDPVLAAMLEKMRISRDRRNEKMLEKYGCRILFDHLAMRGPRVVAANRPLIKAEDYKGLKMRLPSIAASVASFEALGVSPMTSSMGELYQVLQTGTAQACESPISTLDSIAIYEVCDYAMLTDHTYSFRAAHVNEKWWSSLSPAHQEIIQQGIKVGFDRFNELESNGDEAILQKWRDNGMTVIENSEIDTQSIKDVVTPVILEKYKDEWDMSIWDVIQSLR